MKVLIAIDGSPVSEVATRVAIDRPWPSGSEFRLLAVIEPPLMRDSVMLLSQFTAEGHEAAEKELFKAICLLANLDRIVTHTIREGIADEEIINEAKEWGADLIIVGTHGRYGESLKMMGSVAEKVATKAPCSVEIVRNGMVYSPNKTNNTFKLFAP